MVDPQAVSSLTGTTRPNATLLKTDSAVRMEDAFKIFDIPASQGDAGDLRCG